MKLFVDERDNLNVQTGEKIMSSIKDFREGIDIIVKYIPKNGVVGEMDRYEFGDGKIWLGCYKWVTDKKDKKRLEELGWFEDENSWSLYDLNKEKK